MTERTRLFDVRRRLQPASRAVLHDLIRSAIGQEGSPQARWELVPERAFAIPLVKNGTLEQVKREGQAGWPKLMRRVEAGVTRLPVRPSVLALGSIGLSVVQREGRPHHVITARPVTDEVVGAERRALARTLQYAGELPTLPEVVEDEPFMLVRLPLEEDSLPHAEALHARLNGRVPLSLGLSLPVPHYI